MSKKSITAVLACTLALMCGTVSLAEAATPQSTADIQQQIVIPTNKLGGQVLDTDVAIYISISEMPGSENGKVFAYDKASGTLSNFTTASNISQLVSLGDAIYALTPVPGGISLIRITDKCEVMATYPVIDQLSVYEGRLFFLGDGRLMSIMPDGSDLRQHSALAMSQYAIIDGTAYFANMDDAKTYTVNSKLQGQALSLDAGCLYSLNLASGVQVKLLSDGIKSIKIFGDEIYLQYMGESYATTIGGTEQPTGRLCKFDPVTRKLEKLDFQDEYSYFPTAGGLIVHSEYDLALYNGGVYTMSLYKPEINSSVFSVNDTSVMVYEPVSQRLTVISTDINVGPLVVYSSGETIAPDYVRPTLSPSSGAHATISPAPTATPTVRPTMKPTTKPTSSVLKGVIFQDSATRRLTEKEVRALDDDQLIYARYEILARNGYVFKDSKYLKYYRQFSWYDENSSFEFDDLSSIESYNYELIRSIMKDIFATPTPKPTVKPTAKPTVKPTATSVPQDKFIFPNSSTKKLTRDQVLDLDEDDLLEARYEILARNGYVFDTKSWQKYFEKKDWYQPNANFKFGDMSSVESYNYELIRSIDKELNPTPAPSVDPSEFIFPNALTQKLTRDDILSVDPSLWLQARYEILARNGYIFETQSWQKYFSAQSWYVANSDFAFDDMTPMQSYNYELIRQIDKEYNATPAPTDAPAEPTQAPDKPTENPTVKPTAAPTDPADAVLLTESNTRELTTDDLDKLLETFDISYLHIARDEILARHGYVFDELTEDGKASALYFTTLNWYLPDAAFDPAVEDALNEFEIYNLDFMQRAMNGEFGEKYIWPAKG